MMKARDGVKVDYSKISTILTELYDNQQEFISMEYLSADYFLHLNDSLVLATMINAEWAEPTDLGKDQILIAWKTLCDLRDLDYTIMYDKVMDFFKAQEVLAE